MAKSLFDRLLSSVIALSLAFLIWGYARSRDQDTINNVSIPVHISLPAHLADDYELEVPDPCQIQASFTGPRTRIRELRNLLLQGHLCVDVSLNVPDDLQSEGRYADTLRVNASDIHAPLGVTPLLLEGRNCIPVTLHRLVERRLPVRFDHLLEDRVDLVAVEPATVLVRGPREVLDRVRAIPTQLRAMPPSEDAPVGQESTRNELVPLVKEMEGRPIRVKPETVLVRFTVRPPHKTYDLTEVPIQFLCPENFGYRPHFADERFRKIGVRVQGPPREGPPPVIAYIDLTGRKLKAGLYADEPIRVQLPQDFQLAQDPPRSAPFLLAPTDAPPSE